MRITSVDAIMIPPDSGGAPSFASPVPVLCRIHTDEGIYGYGEAGTTFFTGSEAVFAMIKDFAKYIIGMDPMYNEVIWDKIYRNAYWTKGNGGIIFAAISAIDTAIWDIRGKALGKPVYELLGGKFQNRLRCYLSQLQFGYKDAAGPCRTYEDYYNVAKAAIRDGYDSVKVDPMLFTLEKDKIFLCDKQNFGYFDHKTIKIIDERLAATREAVGPDCDIILEMHSSTTLKPAIQVAKIAEKYDIMYLEEPIAPLNPELTKVLAQSTSIPLTTGERSYLRAGFLPFLQSNSLSMLQPDIGICGGITEAKKIADMAYTYDVGIQAHVCGTPVSVAAGVQLEAALSNFTIHETLVNANVPTNMELVVYDDIVPVDGYITVPDRPGIGQELSEKALKMAIIQSVS